MSPVKSLGLTVAATPEPPRLTPLAPREWPDAMREASAPLRPPNSDAERKDRPKGLNVLGMLAWYPELAGAFNTLNGHVLYASTLTPRQRELLALRLAAVRDSRYVWAQHVARAEDSGIDMDEVARVAAGPDAPGWSDLERALLRAVDELLADGRIGSETWSVLAGEFDVQALMDVVFTVGAYDILAMALLTFDVPLDDDLKPEFLEDT
jgi:alkylhydroperoxidase family enzyme